MQKMKVLFSSVFLFSVISAFAQSGRIQGVVADNETNKKLPFAAVSVFEGDSDNLIQGVFTEVDGTFRINDLPFGEYQMVVTFAGYKSDTLKSILLSAQTNPLDLGEIRLFPAVVEIEPVEGVSQNVVFLQKTDRQVFRAADFEMARDGTAADVLNQLPSVSIDPDGMVSVRGSRNFAVYLNGTPVEINPSVLLSQIAASSIQTVEIHNVPTAGFNAQGTGGIVNISTKLSDQKLSLSAHGMLGGAPRGNETDRYSKAKMSDNRFGGGENLFFRNNKLTLFGDANYLLRNTHGVHNTETRLSQTDGSYFYTLASGNRPEQVTSYSGMVGADYDFSEFTSLSFSYYFGSRIADRSVFYPYHTFFADRNRNPMPGIEPLDQWDFYSNNHILTSFIHRAQVGFSRIFINHSKLDLSFLFEHSETNREVNGRDFEFYQSENQVGNLQV